MTDDGSGESTLGLLSWSWANEILNSIYATAKQLKYIIEIVGAIKVIFSYNFAKEVIIFPRNYFNIKSYLFPENVTHTSRHKRK